LHLTTKLSSGNTWAGDMKYKCPSKQPEYIRAYRRRTLAPSLQPTYVRKYRQKNKYKWKSERPEIKKKYSRKYTQTHKAERRAYLAQPRVRIKVLVRNAIARAVKAGLAYDRNYLHSLVPPKRCVCCNAKFVYQTEPTTPHDRKRSLSIDRVCNSKGYVKSNVAMICLRCNILKRDATLTELRKIVAYMERR